MLPRPVLQLPDLALLHVRASGHPTPSFFTLSSTPTCTPLNSGKHLHFTAGPKSVFRQHLSTLSSYLLLLTRCLLGVWDEVDCGWPVGCLCYYLLPPESLGLGHIPRIDRSTRYSFSTFPSTASGLLFGYRSHVQTEA